MALSPKTPAKRIRAAAAKSAATDMEIVTHGEEGPPSPVMFSWLGRGGIRYNEITDFLRQLIMLLEAGTPLLSSLHALAKRGKNPARRALVGGIADFVEAGNPLWQAFDKHRDHFDVVFVNLIKASEASGTLPTVLRRATQYREDREMLRKRVRGAMTYPIILILGCFAILLLLTNVVVPEFKSVFERQNFEIPPITQYFFALSNSLSVWWWTPFAVMLLLYLGYKLWFLRNPLRRLAADRFKLRIPLVGPIIHKNAIVEMTRTMSLLLRSGLSMMNTLELTRNAIHNRAVAHCLQAVRDSVERGGGLEEPFRAASAVIPEVVADMFVTGEQTGRVDAIADQIADVYEEEVRITVAALGEALQPVITVAVGVAVVILFASLFYPIIGMIDSITGAA